MDATTLQVISIAFVLMTALLVYTARYQQGRRGRRRNWRRMPALERLPGWTARSIEADKPLHCAFGGAAIGGEHTAAACASAEFFHHVIAGAQQSDSAPIVSTAAATTLPLAQDNLRRAWEGGALSRAQWYPAGERSLAYAAGLTAALQDSDEPAAHLLAGSFGPELALLLDAADRRGQGSLAVSDQLEGQAVAYAMADAVLIGEELFAAPAYVSEEGRAGIDAAALDAWRGLLILFLALLLLFNLARALAPQNWLILVLGGAVLLLLAAVLSRRG